MTLLLRLLEYLFVSYPSPLSTADFRRVLVIDFNFLGDMILSSPVYRAIKQNLPGTRVEALVFREGAPAMLANPYVDRLHTVVSGSIFRRLAKLYSLKRENFDLVLQLNTSLETNFLMLFTGSRYRLGYNYKHRACFNSIRIPIATRTFKSRNRVDECVELLEKSFGWHITEREMIFNVEERAIRRMRELLAHNGVGPNDVLIGMHTNTRQTRGLRRWGQEKFSSVANFLIEKYGARVVFTGAGEDRNYVGEIIRHISVPDKILDFVGSTSLQELAALLKRLDLFITLNTGPMHIAIAQRTPTVALIGGTPAHVIFPLANPRFEHIMDPGLAAWQPAELVTHHKPAMDSISVEQVLQKVESVLSLRTNSIRGINKRTG